MLFVYRESASLSAGPKAADLAAAHRQLTLNSGSTARHAALRHCCSEDPAKLPRYCHSRTAAVDQIICSSSLANPREAGKAWPGLDFVYDWFQ